MMEQGIFWEAGGITVRLADFSLLLLLLYYSCGYFFKGVDNFFA